MYGSLRYSNLTSNFIVFPGFWESVSEFLVFERFWGYWGGAWLQFSEKLYIITHGYLR